MGRTYSDLRAADPDRQGTPRARRRVQSRERARRPPRELRHRSHALRRVAQDGLDAEPGYEGGMVQGVRGVPAWTHARVDSGSTSPAITRRRGLASRFAERICRPVAHAADRQAGTRPGERRAVLHRSNADENAGFDRLGSQTIDIEAGNGSYAITDSYRLPVDVDVLAIQPHAHNLGRTMRASATLPDGSARTLIDIDDWDFRWQDVYRYTNAIALPRGTTISMRLSWSDNSAANPRNPHHPPGWCVWARTRRTRWATCGSR